MKKIQVSIIEPVGGHGGMNYYNSSLCNELSNIDCDVTLFSCDKTDFKKNDKFKLITSFKGVYGSAPAWLRGIRFVRGAVYSIIVSRMRGVSLFHFHFFQVGVLELFNVMLTRLVFGKVVVTVHDIESFMPNINQQYLSAIVYRFSHVLIVHNQFCKNELVRRTPLLEKKIRVIVHGNYLDSIGSVPSRSIAREKLDIAPDADVLLFFGQIKTVKGLDVLIQAFSLAKIQNPKLYLVIAGKVWKDDFSLYKNMISESNLASSCRLDIRYIADEEVAYYYASADLVVLPYRRIYQSGVLLMAMSFGRAVLVSDLPGMTEVVSDNYTGFVFRSGDEKHLSERILHIVEEKELVENVKLRALALMEEAYGWNRVAKQTLSAYSAL